MEPGGQRGWDLPVSRATLAWPRGLWPLSALCVFAFDPEPLLLSPVLGVRFSPGPPSPPPEGSSFCHGPLGVTCPSILTLSSAPGPGAIRSARPRRWPQMSWIYRAPHAAPRPPFPDYLWLASPSSPSQWPSETEHDVKERAEWSQPQEVTRR